MFTPPNLTIALLMMITSAICWGSWANTYKGVKNYRFELFYWDYAIGIFLISLVGALTWEAAVHDSSSFLNNVHSADTSNILWTMVGGAIFNLANLLLVAAIDMAGLAVALPVSIGIALVVGTMLSYMLQPKGNATVPCDRRRLRADRRDSRRQGITAAWLRGRSVSRKSIVICIVSGVLMGLWTPFVTRSMAHVTERNCARRLTASSFFLRSARCSRALSGILYFMKRPLVGEPVSFEDFFSGPPSGHLLGLARRNHLGHREWFSTWWPEFRRGWRFPMPLGSRRRWSEHCGESSRGRNLPAPDRRQNCYLDADVRVSMGWQFCSWRTANG